MIVGRATTRLSAGHRITLTVSLNRTAQRLLSRHRPLKATLLVINCGDEDDHVPRAHQTLWSRASGAVGAARDLAALTTCRAISKRGRFYVLGSFRDR